MLSNTIGFMFSLNQFIFFFKPIYILVTCFTPFTALSFLMSASVLPASSIITVTLPEKRPSLDEMLMPLITSLSSFEMMLVMLLTMPISSFPMILRVMAYFDVPLPLHFAFTMR